MDGWMLRASPTRHRGCAPWGSEAGGEAGQLQPLDALLVAEGRSADAAGRTSLVAEPRLPADTQHTQNTTQQNTTGQRSPAATRPEACTHPLMSLVKAAERGGGLGGGGGGGVQHLDQRHDGKTQTFPSAAKFNPGNVERDESLMVRERD